MSKFTYLLIDEDGAVFGTNDEAAAKKADDMQAIDVAAGTFQNWRGDWIAIPEYEPPEDESDDEEDEDEE